MDDCAGAFSFCWREERITSQYIKENLRASRNPLKVGRDVCQEGDCHFNPFLMTCTLRKFVVLCHWGTTLDGSKDGQKVLGEFDLCLLGFGVSETASGPHLEGPKARSWLTLPWWQHKEEGPPTLPGLAGKGAEYFAESQSKQEAQARLFILKRVPLRRAACYQKEPSRDSSTASGTEGCFSVSSQRLHRPGKGLFGGVISVGKGEKGSSELPCERTKQH